jgi:hypothetical protein
MITFNAWLVKVQARGMFKNSSQASTFYKKIEVNVEEAIYDDLYNGLCIHGSLTDTDFELLQLDLFSKVPLMQKDVNTVLADSNASIYNYCLSYVTLQSKSKKFLFLLSLMKGLFFSSNSKEIGIIDGVRSFVNRTNEPEFVKLLGVLETHSEEISGNRATTNNTIFLTEDLKNINTKEKYLEIKSKLSSFTELSFILEDF